MKLTRTNAPLSCSGWYKFPDPYIVAEKKFNVKGVLYAKRIFFHRDAYIYISFIFLLQFRSKTASFFSLSVCQIMLSMEISLFKPALFIKRAVNVSLREILKNCHFFFSFFVSNSADLKQKKEKRERKKEIESRVFTTRTRDIISRASFKRCSVHSKESKKYVQRNIESIVIIYKASSTGCVQRLAVFPIRIILHSNTNPCKRLRAANDTSYTTDVFHY